MKTPLFLLCMVVFVVLVACAAPPPTATPVPSMTTPIPPTATPVPPTPTAIPLAPTPAKPGNQVLLVAQEASANMELMLTKEVGVMMSMLEKAGFKVVVASPSGQPIIGGAAALKPDMKLADVKVEDYAGFILPCMAAEGTIPEAVEIVKKANALGKPIAAQNSSVFYLLAKAGLLSGKQYAFHPGYEQYIPGGIYKGAGVVQDGNMITSGSCPYTATPSNPDTTIELSQKFVDLLKSVR